MIPFTASEIARIVGGRLSVPAGAEGAEAGPFAVARIDSRDVEPGDLFVCAVGDQLDGHDFVGEARERGAALVLASRDVDGEGPVVVVDDVLPALALLARAVVDARPSMSVVGITGSSGKTSTKDLLAQVLEAAAPTVSPPGSFNNELGLPLTVLRTDESTRFLVLEMGARGIGHVRDLCAAAAPSVGVVLNVGTAHLGEFGGRDAVARAKGELVESLPADGIAVLNADDPAVAAMAARTRARVLTFGRAAADGAAGPDVRADDVVVDASARATFTLVHGEVQAPVRLQVVGAHQVENALAAAAAALALGLDLVAVADALSSAGARSAWRMEVTERADGVTVVNDAYNANPESVAAALESVAAIGVRAGRRTWAVLGEMRELGELSEQAHEDAGRRAAELGASQVLAVGDAARPVVTGTRGVPGWSGTARTVTGVDDAVALLERELAPGDVVLIKASRAAGLERIAAALLVVMEAPA